MPADRGYRMQVAETAMMPPRSSEADPTMTDSSMYRNGSRELRDQSDTRRLADRLEMRRLHATFSERDRAVIERAAMFFLATADAAGQPDCSYEGGLPGFIRMLTNESLPFPDYDGNGPFRSLGNNRVNPRPASAYLISPGSRRRCRRPIRHAVGQLGNRRSRVSLE